MQVAQANQPVAIDLAEEAQRCEARHVEKLAFGVDIPCKES
jgi:hypothetical protein